MRAAITLLFLAALAGCASSPRPAKTNLVGGESRLFSERFEKRPVETRMVITAESVPPTFIIHLTPVDAPAPTPPEETPQ